MLSLDTKDIIDSLNFMSVIDIVSKMTSNFTNLMYIHQRSISQHSTDASKILHEHYYDLISRSGHMAQDMEILNDQVTDQSGLLLPVNMH